MIPVSWICYSFLLKQLSQSHITQTTEKVIQMTSLHLVISKKLLYAVQSYKAGAGWGGRTWLSEWFANLGMHCDVFANNEWFSQVDVFLFTNTHTHIPSLQKNHFANCSFGFQDSYLSLDYKCWILAISGCTAVYCHKQNINIWPSCKNMIRRQGLGNMQ